MLKALLIISCILVIQGASRGSDYNLHLEDVLRGLERIEEIETTLEKTAKVLDRYIDKKGIKSKEEIFELVWMKSPLYFFLERKNIVNDKYGPSGVHVGNPIYEFSVAQGNSETKNWILNHFQIINEDKQRTIPPLQYRNILHPLTSILNTPGKTLSELIRSKLIKILHSKSLGELVQVEIQFNDNPTPSIPEKTKYIKGKITFNPNNYWGITRYELTDEKSVNINSDIEFLEKPYQGILFPSVMTIKYSEFRNEMKNAYHVRVINYKSYNEKSPHTDKFYLNYYGIYEHNDVEGGGRLYFFILLLIFCTVILFGCLFLARKNLKSKLY